MPICSEYAARRIGDQSGSLVVDRRPQWRHPGDAVDALVRSQQFSDGISGNEWKMLSQDDHLPLVDKVLEGLYPSGSTIKPLMALAILKAGRRPQAERRLHTAAIRSATTSSTATRVHGPIDMRRCGRPQLRHLFLRRLPPVGAERLAPMVKRMGFGEKFDLPFDFQRFGTVPDPEWMRQQISPRVADLRHDQHVDRPGQCADQPAAAGGDAARGSRAEAACVPRLLDGRQSPPAARHRRRSRASRIRPPGDGRRRNERGTAGAAKLPLDGIQMAGKTGTAQVRITMPSAAARRTNESQLEAARPSPCSWPSPRSRTRATRPRA